MGFGINQPQISRNIKGQPDDYNGFIYETNFLVDNIYDVLPTNATATKAELIQYFTNMATMRRLEIVAD